MASHHTAITPEQRALIEGSRLFFVASAHPQLEAGEQGQGPVNLSPKGNVPLHVVSEEEVAYLDYHGSGNETAKHAAGGGPITIMLMSMDGEDAAIVRLYGRATIEPLEGSPIAETLLRFASERKGLRQIVRVRVESTQTSCGYGVPVYSYVGSRSHDQRGRRFKQ